MEKLQYSHNDAIAIAFKAEELISKGTDRRSIADMFGIELGELNRIIAYGREQLPTPKRQRTPEERQEIYRRIKEKEAQGKSNKEIAKLLGVDYYIVMYYLRTYRGYKKEPIPEPPTDVIVEDVVRYEGGRLQMSGMVYTAEDEEAYQRWAHDSSLWFHGKGRYATKEQPTEKGREIIRNKRWYN